jgi:hypothetical protein
VKLVGVFEAMRRCGGERDVAARGGEAFGQTIHVVLAGEAAGKFFGKKIEKFHADV